MGILAEATNDSVTGVVQVEIPSGISFPDSALSHFNSNIVSKISEKLLTIEGALDNFSLIPKFFSKKLRFLYH